MSKLGLPQAAGIVLVLCITTALASPAQTFTTLYSFCSQSGCPDGAGPVAGLVQGTDGNFYGTTVWGGAYGGGTVFKITAGGTLTTLYIFCSQNNCTDGNVSTAGLVQGTDGNFYGTTSAGGAYGEGTVFKITPAGALTTLYSFCSQNNCPDGATPNAGLVQGTDENFYGTTMDGGAYGYGAVFKITPAGALTTLYSFCAQNDCTDGYWLNAGLVQGTDGNFYGTTGGGGAYNSGTVFKISAGGTLTTLYSFCPGYPNCPDGDNPYAGLVQGTDGNFYGTTMDGGANGDYGTVFKMTPAGALTTLYSFCGQTGCPDGYSPWAGLVQGTDGNFYGTTAEGGAYGDYGTVFKMTPAGALTTLYSFCSQYLNCTDGDFPQAGLVQGTNGNFYGTTYVGGATNSPDCTGIGCGTVFKLAEGLGRFVETRPTSGKVGTKVIILGNNLKGTTLVAFHGTKAQFKVVSNTQIKTSVPSGATTGFVTVTTPTKKLKSNVKFRVTQ